MGREQWVVRNITQRHVNIGDLFRVPTISPGQNRDLLTYHTHGEITQSNNLATLLSTGWLRLTKSDVPSSVQINRIEQDELDAAIAEADPQTVTITNSFVINDDVIDIVLSNASLNNLTVTLPLASSNRQLYIKKIDPTNNVVTVSGQNGQLIDGSVTWEISTQYVTMELVADGSNWHIL